MKLYRLFIVSGTEYVVTVAANTEDEARAYALDLDVEQWEETHEVETLVTTCKELEPMRPFYVHPDSNAFISWE